MAGHAGAGERTAVDPDLTDRQRPRIVLVGLGAHAAHVYLPWIDGHRELVELAGVVDLGSAADAVRSRLARWSMSEVPQVWVEPGEGGVAGLSNATVAALDALGPIRAIVVSTEPLAHIGYARWALSHRYSVLSDKPVLTSENMSSSSAAASRVRAEFGELLAEYRRARQADPRCRFTVSTHRRYHGGFQLVRDCLAEVRDLTGWPVTSIDAELADGEWRLPYELLHQDYHPLNRGYGALSHSGYHVIDQFCVLAESAEPAPGPPDAVTAFASAVRPPDVLVQFPAHRLRQLFPDDNVDRDVRAETAIGTAGRLGELDVAAVVNLRRDDAVVLMGKLSVTHHSVSSRAWSSSAGRDLYRGNGRVRQESWTIHQGPMQTIRILSAQTDKSDPDRTAGWRDIGGKEHFDVHVFRNTGMVPKWDRLRTYHVDELVTDLRDRAQGGHHDVAKAHLIEEFVRNLWSTRPGPGRSDLLAHQRSHEVWCVLNESLARQFEGEPGVVSARLPA